MATPFKKTHGMTASRVYRIWNGMMRRCYSVTDSAYANYGGRGIKVCEEWHDFSQFYTDMGDPPFIGAQIDRIDNNEGYSLENCRWVTREENSRNTRRNRYVVIQGTSMCVSEACRFIGVEPHKIYYAVKRKNISFQEAIDIETAKRHSEYTTILG